MIRTRPRVIAFDVNETLLDLAPVRAALVAAGQPPTLLATVFARTLLTGFAATAVGDWCRFRDAFDAALAQVTDLDEPVRARVAEAFGELAPHPDVEPALRPLGSAGVRVVAPADLALVAAHGWDVLGAQRAGLTGAWFPRAERSYPAVHEAPHVSAPDLAGAVEALLALP